jgi:hypothetical protein
MSAPFLFSLRMSASLRLALCLTHGLPPLATLMLEVNGWLFWPVLALSLGSGLWHGRRARRLAVTSIRIAGSGEAWLLVMGEARAIEILPASKDLGWLIVLVWREPGSERIERAALTREGLPPDTWRALRRYLRWELPQQAFQEP